MKVLNGIFLCGLTFVVGCGASTVGESGASSRPSPEGASFIATTEPADAVPVGAARKSAENEQDVTIIGTIGGSSDPFVDGLVAFTIVDPKVPHCSADEGCPTPWDYCCTQDQVKQNIATVKIVDASGSPLPGNAREFLGVKELSTIAVQGRATRDDQGNLTIAATKVFVRPSE